MGTKLQERLSKIKLVIFDVDGVLTDGKIYCGVNGECMKVFNTKDNLGITRLRSTGMEFGIITGRESTFVKDYAATRDIQYVYQKTCDKLPIFEDLRKKLGLSNEEVAYMGDDLIDVPVMEHVGFAGCPADAMPCVKKIAHFISQYNGGCGAAREFCDLIFETQHPCDI